MRRAVRHCLRADAVLAHRCLPVRALYARHPHLGGECERPERSEREHSEGGEERRRVEAPPAAQPQRQQRSEASDEKNEAHTCKICFEKPADCVILECGHICACMGCAQPLKLCPMCRQPIARVVKTFQG